MMMLQPTTQPMAILFELLANFPMTLHSWVCIIWKPIPEEYCTYVKLHICMKQQKFLNFCFAFIQEQNEMQKCLIYYSWPTCTNYIMLMCFLNEAGFTYYRKNWNELPQEKWESGRANGMIKTNSCRNLKWRLKFQGSKIKNKVR